jgi:hypothetical protein
MGTNAQFADENIQCALQCCRFGGAASYPNLSPPSHPHRDTDDRAGRDDADRKNDRQRRSNCSSARRHREWAARMHEKAECLEPASGP